ncbi:MAG TPA: hypothetical protein VE646_12650 [Actinomycetota bacterium]|jgi:hypothetical protein|nr:hypothetical protein [Actinomycetota bacterium]
MAREIDWALFEKAVDITASAVRGAMGGENSQPPKFAAEVFREVWGALKEAVDELPEKGKAGF